MTSSAASPLSDKSNGLRTAAVAASLAILVALAALWCFRSGYILYYGDAQAHLNISRGLIDSRTPGYDQLGTVWLPVLHLLCLPFVGNDALWSTGLAGTIPVACCFVVAGTCFYLAAREAYQSSIAALVALACFALNPNILYLAVIPMTEIVFLAGISVLLLSLLRFRSSQNLGWIVMGVLMCWFVSLTRYDGWFLIPFAAAWFAWSASRKKLIFLIAVGAAASLAPLYWMAHNWWETGNALDFYNGPYSAAAIQGPHSYPGHHDWLAALHYYGEAGRLCSGWMLILPGAAGLLCAIRYRLAEPLLFLALTPLFYVWNMHSSAAPIHVPNLWPFSYYNSRYGIAVTVLCAFAAGALVPAFPTRLRRLAVLIPILSVLPWIIHPGKDNWICWKESEVNSDSRRAWTAAAARFLESHYRTGQGILTSSGDITAVYCRARIPLSETLNIGNGPAWMAATVRPDLFHPALWALAQDKDALAKALGARSPSAYAPVLTVKTKDDPLFGINRRTSP